MNFEDTVQICMKKYPKLFLDRWEVLNYLFCSLHCDHRWTNGELVGEIQTSYYQSIPLYGEQIVELNRFREKLWQRPYYFYPLGRSYSNLFNFPKTIQSDWLEGIIETIEFILKNIDPWEDVYMEIPKAQLESHHRACLNILKAYSIE
ncbi:hypothetical protein HNQ80_001351 [Anaerosolibacter carboniphilus]|uniref:Uncharacterized protein n=1 Tax=Anaerosolibacter carboniphilus TaxID=1417629 RepID=A0A841KWG2_9FIRM|nr:hypothetical protein [Anaerosolibacter carboniphilus]MBB6215262.1 hypothetical protein [Anaerosolibacter carboniphilus]